MNQAVQLPSSYSAATRLFTTDPLNHPARIRMGDINIDGYVDLLFIVNDPATTDPATGSIVLAMNEQATIVFNGNVAADDQSFYTLLDDDITNSLGDKALNSIPAISASFFDFDELG